MTGVYELIKTMGYVPYETCMPYLACSSDSTEGFCEYVDTSCTPINICRTCVNPHVKENDGACVEIDYFPNATVEEYGFYELDVDAIMAEIYMRGPVATEVAGEPLHEYQGGIFCDQNASRNTTHIVSIVGWGKDKKSGKKHWVRTSAAS
jgi:cathepsin X